MVRFFYNYSNLTFQLRECVVKMIPRSRVFVVLLAVTAAVATALSCNCTLLTLAGPLSSSPIQIEAGGSNYTVNVTGEVIDTDGFLVIADFSVELINNRTDLRLQSEPFGYGVFRVPVVIPLDALENDTLTVRVLSLDGQTVYGTSYLKLNDTAPDRAFFVQVLVENPPPNYNGLLIIILVIIFALILAGYIISLKWFIGRTVMKRANETMIDKQMRRGGGEGGGEI
jgi:hypothetical protein